MSIFFFWLAVAFGAVIAYLLGSVNFAIIVTKLFKKGDIRDYGSGNAGMTNVLRTVGKGAAALTLLGDFSKGIISVIIMRLLVSVILPSVSVTVGQISFTADYIAIYGALLGHVFPLYYHFKGGKGILVSFGAIMILSPLAGIICLLGFLIAVAFSKYVSLGSIVAAILFPVSILALGVNNPDITTATMLLETVLSIPVSGFIIYMHRANIKRLMNGTESKISFKKIK